MGREVRRVPANWEHPKKADGSYQPLFDEDFESAARTWKEGLAAWERRDLHYFADHSGLTPEFEGEFWEWDGLPPDRDYYRPVWTNESRTHYQMYETTTEGTPISPVMPDIESLAHWLADNGASAFGGMTATYEQWLATCKAGWAPSGVFSPQTGFVSGVEFSTREPAS